MPRRLPVRPAKVIGNLFVLFVIIVISLIYYTYMVLLWGPKAQDSIPVMVMLAFFHLLFILLLWSFFQSMTTDPGQVPVFWGFHLGDPENKRRRYCLMCNVFKPERCHHCSACNRCVLNMDHHCPWINNCVGFWNRKYFLLLLIYVLLTTYYVAITMAYDFFNSLKWQMDAYYFQRSAKDQQQLMKMIVIQFSYLINGMVAVLMTFFLKFHLYLASTNKTTIENLDKKGRPYKSVYDIGPLNNWHQIFGTNRYLWPFPLFAGSGKPLGDGIYWPGNTDKDEYGGSKNLESSPEKKSISPSKVGDSAKQQFSGGGVASPKNIPKQYQQYNQYQTNMGGQFGVPGGPYDQSQTMQLSPEQQEQYRMRGSSGNVVSYPQQQQFFYGGQQQQQFLYQQQQQEQQQEIIGQQQNRIIMHGQDRDQLKKNLNAAIFQNNLRAQELKQKTDKQKEKEEKQLRKSGAAIGGVTGGSSVGGSAVSGKIDPKKRKNQEEKKTNRKSGSKI